MSPKITENVSRKNVGEETSSFRPYKYKSAVQTRSEFYGFENHLRTMEENINSSIDDYSENICFIGEPSTGKTSFINVCKEYCNEVGFLTAKIDLEDTPISNPLKFFETLYTQILDAMSKIKVNEDYPFKDYYDNYKNIVDLGIFPKNEQGESDPFEFDLRFPGAYREWLDNQDRKIPINSALIKIDFETIHKKYFDEYINNNEVDSGNYHGKIAILIDDFQKILGDEIVATLDTSKDISKAISVQLANTICDILKSIIDNMPGKYCFCIASYPELTNNDLCPRQAMFLERHFDLLHVNRFQSEKETKELIAGPLKHLPENHPWKCFTREDGVTRENNIRMLEFRELVRRVHSESEGRPYDIKLQMFHIFKEFKKPTNNVLIDYTDDEKWLRIYKSVLNKFGGNMYYEKVKKYSLEMKFHLLLFLNNLRLTCDKIAELVNLEVVLFNTNYCFNKGYDLVNIDSKTLADPKNYLGKHYRHIKGVTSEKLKKSHKIFSEDGILERVDEKILHEFKGKLNDLRYIRYYLRSLELEDILNRSQHSLIEKIENEQQYKAIRYYVLTRFAEVSKTKDFLAEKLNITIFYFTNFGNYNNPLIKINLRPDLECGDYLEKLFDFIKNFNYDTETLIITDEIQKTIIEDMSVFIFDALGFSGIEDLNLEIYKMNTGERTLLFFGMNLKDRLPILYRAQKYFNEKQIDFNIIEFIGETHIPAKFFFSIANTFKIPDDEKEKFPIFMEFQGMFQNPVFLWKQGEKDKAYKTQLGNILGALEKNAGLENIKLEGLSNCLYLALCENKQDTIKECYEKLAPIIHSKISNSKEITSILIFNYLLIRFLVGNDFDPPEFFEIYKKEQHRLMEGRLVTCLVLVCIDKIFSVIEIYGLDLELAWLLSILTLISAGKIKKENRSFITNLIIDYVKEKNVDTQMLIFLKEKYPHFEEILKHKI